MCWLLMTAHRTARLILFAVATAVYNTVFLEEREGKLGLGTAYIHGFKWAIERLSVIYLKWMPTFRIILLIFHGYTRPAKPMAPMLLLVRVM